jgi:hypothetical protein
MDAPATTDLAVPLRRPSTPRVFLDDQPLPLRSHLPKGPETSVETVATLNAGEAVGFGTYVFSGTDLRITNPSALSAGRYTLTCGANTETFIILPRQVHQHRVRCAGKLLTIRNDGDQDWIDVLDVTVW